MRAVADRVGILVQGRLVQTGTPEEVHRSPAHPDVARLFRLGTIVSARATPEGSGSRIELQGFVLHTDQHGQGDVQLLIRAARLRIRPGPSKESHIAGRVESVLWGNSTVRVDLRAGQTSFRAELSHAEARELSLKEGSEVAVVCPPEAIHLFPKMNERP
jgi:molybdate/tungstate transport system ATP-binding protein